MVAGVDGQKGIPDFGGGGNLFFQGAGISDDEKALCRSFHQFSNGTGTLDPKGRLVVASLYTFSGLRQEKHTVSFDQMIQVGAAVFSRFPAWENDDMDSFLRPFTQVHPPGGEEKSAQEGFLLLLKTC